MHVRKLIASTLLLLISLWAAGAGADGRIAFVQDTLSNGLDVIYAPVPGAPVVHVRVLYHVGSKDERPDRQGFAHLFEHMMFRGSRHVDPEEHMKLVDLVGGRSNAFTTYDQTVYVNTVPSNQLDLALYLEADRMASFRVSREIFDVERKVVAEEWRRRQNQPYGDVFERFAELFYTRHPYRWTPIGDMDQLAAATVEELQTFFDTFYTPSNAVLVIAGDFDLAEARAAVGRYFGWVPAGRPVRRQYPAEPTRTEPIRAEILRPVPLARIQIGYPTPRYGAEDHLALDVLASILGGSRSSRLERRLVTGEDPLCVAVRAYSQELEDGGVFTISATVMAGKDRSEVEEILRAALAEIAEKGVTPEELQRAKVLARVALVRSRKTASAVASVLGTEALLSGDPDRVNELPARLDALTSEAVRDAARRYFRPERAVTLVVTPGTPEETAAVTAKEPETIPARETRARETAVFPDGYPTEAPVAGEQIRASFAKGVTSDVGGVRVIVLPDHRVPTVSWTLALRGGSHADPAGREGLAELTAALLRRGAAGLGYQELNADLESKGIDLSVSDGGDVTRVRGSALTEYAGHGIRRTRELLREPLLAPEEFARVKDRTQNYLRLADANPDSVASRELSKALFGATPLGTQATAESVEAIALEDVRAFYREVYRPEGAVLVVSGDVTPERGRELAEKLLEGWEGSATPRAAYELPRPAEGLRIVVVDRPEGQQSLFRMGVRAYNVTSQEKFAGALVNEILSGGIHARLGKAVRAERGLAYSVWGRFVPERQAGRFIAGAETDLETTAEAVDVMLTVFRDVAANGVAPDELREAKLRVTGSMVMGMQTAEQQAGYRLEGILNGYSPDYYDRYPDRVTEVSRKEVAAVARQYLTGKGMTVVVVAPAGAVVEQLQALGPVEVVPMPGAKT